MATIKTDTVYVSTYSQGNVFKQRHYDSDGLLHGPYKVFSLNGTLAHYWEYFHGVKYQVICYYTTERRGKKVFTHKHVVRGMLDSELKAIEGKNLNVTWAPITEIAYREVS